MITVEQRRKADAFKALHDAPPLLVLPNAWDVASAKLFEVEGFKAIGTTSAGISAALGYPDVQKMSLEENAEVVHRITRRVAIPVSADMEAGYADSTDGVADAAKRMLYAGAVGVNLEDGTGNPAKPLFERSLMMERIRAIREGASSEGIHLVVNARIDVYLSFDGKPSELFRRTVERAGAYGEAGADCIFVPTPLDKPGMLDRDALVSLVENIDAPLNVLGGSVTLPIPELEEIGVARVSLGPGPMRATLALLRKIAGEVKNEGTYNHIMNDAIPYSEVNQWFAG